MTLRDKMRPRSSWFLSLRTFRAKLRELGRDITGSTKRLKMVIPIQQSDCIKSLDL